AHLYWRERAGLRRKQACIFPRRERAHQAQPSRFRDQTLTSSLTLSRDALHGALASLQRVVERRNTIPVLSNVALSARGGRMMLTATDLDIEAVAVLEAAGDLATTVPAHLLHDILRKLPEGLQVNLAMDAEQARLVVRGGRSRFTLQALPIGDFPSLAAGEMPARFTLAAGHLAQLFANVQFAISTEETRYYLNGIYLHIAEEEDGPMLTAVATDGHRLARERLPAPEGAGALPGIIVPRKTVGEVLAALKGVKDSKAAVTIEASSAKIRFILPGITLTSKLIDGTFPDYIRVIPAANEKRLVAEREALLAAVDRVSTISSERGRAVRFTLTDGKLTLSVSNPDAGSASEEMQADYEGPDFETGYNARYLADMLGQIAGDTVLFKLGYPDSLALAQSRDGASALFVLMPMRV
ncbi:MAG: DNA polymerase III subunit beta, partial [Ralstonia sp.]